LFAVFLGAGLCACDPVVEGEDAGAGDASIGANAGEPVPCADLECGGNQICVKPEWGCDHSECGDTDGAEWIKPPPFCAELPAECADKQDSALASCLSRTLCDDPYGPLYFIVDDRDLQCGGESDCLCGGED